MATKKEEFKLNIPLEGVRAKLQTARVCLQQENLTKTGKNDFAHFDFFQLQDFLPSVNEIFARLGLYSEFSISPQVIDYEETSINQSDNTIVKTKKPIIREMALLEITDVQKPEEILTYSMEVAPVMIGNNTKQNIYQAAGGRNTYYKRYLYMNALEIVESDECDAVLGQEGVNYQQPVMPQNNFVQPQAQPIQTTQVVGGWEPQTTSYDVSVKPLQHNMPDPNPGMSAKQLAQMADNMEAIVDQVREEVDNSGVELSTESKMEIMQLVSSKGLNGAEIISDFCKQNGLNGPKDLLESHKAGLIDMVNNL